MSARDNPREDDTYSLVPRFWRAIWWQPFNNEYERTSEWLYQYSQARDWVFRDPSKRFQISDETEYINHPDAVLPDLGPTRGDAMSGRDNPREYETTIEGKCPDCGPCLVDRFGGAWKCGKCGREIDP